MAWCLVKAQGQLYLFTLGRTFSIHEKLIQNFSQKNEMKKPVGRRWGGWDDNIRMDLEDTRWAGVDRIGSSSRLLRGLHIKWEIS
jgi:hypothetical protein